MDNIYFKFGIVDNLDDMDEFCEGKLDLMPYLSEMRAGISRYLMSSMASHPAAMRVLRSVNSRLVGINQYFHLIFGSASYQPVQPSDQTLHAADALFLLLALRRGEEIDVSEESMWNKVHLLLRDCTELSSLGQVSDNEGFSVLLRAVLQEDTKVLDLLVEEGCNLNSSKCTLPLHLACKRGELHMVQYLLASGASADVETGMCYPKHHAPTVHVPSRFHFLETDIFECDSNHRLPLMYALEGDHLNVVQYLLSEGLSGTKWPYQRHPLHHACAHGAYNCVQYLSSQPGADVSRPDTDGLPPLMHAVPWGLSIVKLLVESGANVQATTFKRQGALHTLYMYVRDPRDILPTTRFLLGAGMETSVSIPDHQGNSPLHALVTLLCRKATSFPSVKNQHQSKPFTSDVNSSLNMPQEEYETQLLLSIEALLKFNADPNLVNSSGVTPLHKMLLMVDTLMSNSGGMTLEILAGREDYKLDFDVLRGALEIMFEYGADANLQSSAGRPTLLILLQMALNMDPLKLSQYAPGFLKCLQVVLEAGAKPSSTIISHIHVVTYISKLGHKCLQLRDPDMKATAANFLKEVMALLLQNGMESNHCNRQKTPQVDGASGNVLLEMVRLARLARSPEDLEIIHSWVLTMLQGSANPDLEPYPSEPIICQSQSSIFLQPKGTQAVNMYMCELADFRPLLNTPQAERLLLLFYNTMDHAALYQCMSTAKFLSRFDSNRAPSGGFLHTITELSSQPRSLKQISRVAIYKAMDRKLSSGVPHLPLPKPMKQYLLNIE